MGLIVAQGPDVLNAHLDVFSKFEVSLINQFHHHVVPAMPTRYVHTADDDPKARPHVLNVKTFELEEGKVSISGSALFKSEQERVGMAWHGKLGGRAQNGH